jgi:hypothetical protein
LLRRIEHLPLFMNVPRQNSVDAIKPLGQDRPLPALPGRFALSWRRLFPCDFLFAPLEPALR